MPECRTTYVCTTRPRWRGWRRSAGFGPHEWCRAPGFDPHGIACRLAVEWFDWPHHFEAGPRCARMGLAECST